MAIKEVISRIFAGVFSIFATAFFLFALGIITKIFIKVFMWGYRIVL
jgi:hypothetical protein